VSTRSDEIAAEPRGPGVDAVASADPVALAQRIPAIASDKTSLLSLQTEVDSQANTLTVEALSVVGSNNFDFYSHVHSALDGKPLRKADLEAKTRVA
jgi:hypothetical protein